MNVRPTTPLVSVVVPTYNRGRVIQRAVDSVLAQNVAGVELIVVDDGSTDETRRVLAAYGDRLRLIRQRNRGVSAARNAGIRAASGRLIAFLDSDDAWLPGKLRAQIDHFERYPDALIGQTDEIWVRNGVRVNPGRRHRKQAGMIFERSLARCLVSPSAVMIRKRLFDEVGLFDERLPACEDYDLWLRIAWKYPIHLVDRPLIVKHGGHADQLSRMPGLDKYRIQSLSRLLDRGCLSPHQHRVAVDMLAAKCTIYAQGCRKRGRVDAAAAVEAVAAAYTP